MKKTIALSISALIIIGLILIISINIARKNAIPPAPPDLRLISFNGACGEPDGGPSEPKIVKKEFNSNILKLTALTSSVCCLKFEKGKVEYSDGSINLKYTQSGEPCDCICSSTLHYEIQGATSDTYHFNIQSYNNHAD